MRIKKHAKATRYGSFGLLARPEVELLRCHQNLTFYETVNVPSVKRGYFRYGKGNNGSLA